MPKQAYTEEEKAYADEWLTLASRYIANTRGAANTCKRRACKQAGLCMATGLNDKPDRDACGHPLRAGDVALTVHLALFGMMLDASKRTLSERLASDAHIA